VNSHDERGNLVGAALGSTGIASAATVVSPTGGRVTKPVATLSAIEGHSTGQGGGLSEGECRALGNRISGLNQQAANQAAAGDAKGAVDTGETANFLENVGLDQGCFFID
jgi:hypothetical protein